jgi:hypothetical protein
MSSALMLVVKTLPLSVTLENSLAFLAFRAMTFSSIVLGDQAVEHDAAVCPMRWMR